MGFDDKADFKYSRRELLKLAGASLASCALGPASPRQTLARDNRPNFIFILADDHRWDALGHKGHPFIQTTHLDRIAQEGVSFSNAFVTTPLCSPSRASFLTGQYAHRHGVKNNLTPWDDRNPTVLEHLRNAGYRNAFIGKWHMPGRLPDILGRAVDRFVTFTASGGQGVYFDCPLIIDGKIVERKGKYLPTDLTDLALEFIRREKDRPFCLYLAHKAVHQPFWPPPDLTRLYEDVAVARLLPPEYHSWVSLKEGSGYYGLLGGMEKFYRDYARVITALDREVGRILGELDRLGLTANTVVAYAGDNGFFWGEKQLIDKRWLYEESTRIPFLVRYPAGLKDPGRTADDLILNVDLAPTLLKLAGLPIPEAVQGKSLVPLLENQTGSFRKSFHMEYFKDFPYSVPEHDAVRTDRYLYLEYQGGKPPELFDVQKDPRTLRNLIAAPEGKRVLPELKELLKNYLRGKKHG
jgi:N-acetylglucosamine-6-sulfatase